MSRFVSDIFVNVVTMSVKIRASLSKRVKLRATDNEGAHVEVHVMLVTYYVILAVERSFGEYVSVH